MKSKHLLTAIAAGLALNSGASFALAPNVTPDIEIWMSGATAQDGNIGQLFQELCKPGTLDTFRDGVTGTTTGAAHSAYFCNLDTAKVTGLSQTEPKVLFHKTSSSREGSVTVGGSGIGVNPVLLKQQVDAMVISNGNCQAPANGESFYRCRINQPGDTIRQVPDAGVSDVNPELFVGPNTPANTAPVDAAQVARLLEVKSGGTLVFNTPVTLDLRNTLQKAQIFTGQLAADCEGQETEACMPSLSKNQLAALFAGSIGKWDTIKVVSKDGVSRPLTDFGSPGDNKVHICRRVDGSGTQASLNAKILNAPCTPGAKNPAATSNDAAGPIVRLNPGSGDVDRCLDDHDKGANSGGLNPTNTKAWAIGIQTTERNTKNTLQYRYIKHDGQAPTIENAAAGRYGFAVEVTYQWLKSGGPTGDKAKIINKIATDAGKPSIIANNNKAFAYSWGQGGYLAVSASGHPVSENGVLDVNAPVTPYTHAPDGLLLDNCRVPVIDDNKANRL
ncbi:MAG: hypothetical protein LUO80_07290 [Methylococcaceae bacterium]|nr:hypothetical protein [Methylococcaceae bacterium]